MTSLAAAKTKRPSNRDNVLNQTAEGWLEGKRMDDDIGENVWRVHDSLYDLNEFIHLHPGGADWLVATRGTDITEAFESHHPLNESATRRLLGKYRVSPIDKRRFTPYSFESKGFYATFKRRVAPILRRPEFANECDAGFRLVFDALLIAWTLCLVVAAHLGSLALAVVGGIVLAMNTIAAHNYFHQRQSWRMFVFDVSGFSSFEWRVSHALSHHLFPNSVYDLEVSGLEPMLYYLPDPAKSAFRRFAPLLYSLPLYALGWLLESTKRAVKIATHVGAGDPLCCARAENLLPAAPLVVAAALAPSLSMALLVYAAFMCSSSFYFLLVGLAAAHHHPDAWHDGDAPKSGDASVDFGVAQIDAVRDRPMISGADAPLFLVATAFGNHALHHLLPTVSHGHLSHRDVQAAFEQTLDEFNIRYCKQTQLEMFVGGFRQLARNFYH
jgi:Cytochrome b5-like Heme/Steroid binding domain